MKKRLLVGCVAVASVVFGYGQAAGPQRQSQGASVSAPTSNPVTPAARQRVPGPDVASASAERALLDQYCVTCHNDRTKRANLSLEKLDLDNGGRHPPIVGKSRAQTSRWRDASAGNASGRILPPTTRSRSGWKREIDRKAAGKVNPGTKVLHRLNRAEYANAIHDLLDLEIDPATLLAAGRLEQRL